MDTSPVGFVDSGSGGLTVMQACRRLLPHENFVYVSDSRGRWGNLTPARIVSRVDACMQLLRFYRCKAAVLACNTATAAAIEEMRRRYEFPVVGSEPALRPARAAYPDGNLLLLCTPATARQSRVASLVRAHMPVTVRPLPDLAAQVERHLYAPEALAPVVRRLLEGETFRAVVLGCTHYVCIRDLFERYAAEFCDMPPEDGNGARLVFDGCDGVARRLMCILRERDMLAPARIGQEVYDAV